MRILQTYNWRCIKMEIQGFLLFNNFNLNTTSAIELNDKLFELGFTLYPVYPKITNRLCTNSLISFFESLCTFRLNTLYLLMFTSSVAEKFLELMVFRDLENFLKNKFVSAQCYLLYNNLFIEGARKAFLFSRRTTAFYKDFFKNFRYHFYYLFFYTKFFIKIIFFLK